MQPAIRAGGNPILVPIPSIATPRVPAVVHELPIEMLTIEQTMRQVTRKNFGETIFSP